MKIKLNKLVSQLVLGGIDGIVTTFSVIAAASGAGLGNKVVIIMGMANLISDGLSLGISNYLAESSEAKDVKLKRNHIVKMLEKNVDQALSLVSLNLTKFGLSGDALNRASSVIVQDKSMAEKFILKQEHNMEIEDKNPKVVGISSFLSFITLGSIPLIPYFMNLAGFRLNPFKLTIVFATVGFLIIGYLKSYTSAHGKLASVIQTIVLGAVASGAAYGIGYWLQHAFGV